MNQSVPVPKERGERSDEEKGVSHFVTATGVAATAQSASSGTDIARHTNARYEYG